MSAPGLASELAATCGRPPSAPHLRRDEIAFRAEYGRLVEAGLVTTVFRPGDRRYPCWRGYIEGELVTARIIAQPGCDMAGRAPRFTAFGRSVCIAGLKVVAIEALRPGDFSGSSTDVFDAASLQRHLEGIYGRPLAEWGGVVTRIALDWGASQPRWRRARALDLESAAP